MKRSIKMIYILILLFTIVCSSVFCNQVKANNYYNNIIYYENGYVQEIKTDNIDKKKWIVVDSGTTYHLLVNYKENYLKIDNEKYHSILKK